MLQSSELKEEISSVVEAIDNVFRIEGDLEESDVEQLHSRLVACVDAVNVRLQRCDALLRKGLKSEAIQEAEIAPNVLELVDELDAMEAWDGWSDYVRQFGIPPQPNLLVDIAAALNLAYSHAQPIDRLLRQHRLFALARVPLRDRIPVLRELAARDADTAVWKDDLKQYETSRLMQIDSEFRVADRARDLPLITTLREELEKSPWTVTPAQNLRNAVATVYENLRIATATEKLTSIASEMNAAFSDFDLPRARLVRNQWDRYNEIANLNDDSELVHEVAAAFQWLDDEQEAEERQLAYQRAIAELEQGLDQHAIRRVELDRLFASAERFDSPIPDRLIRRYDERLRVLTASERRRGILVLVGSLATLLIIASVVGIFAWFQWRSSQVSNFEESLTALVKAEKLDEAEAMIASLDGGKQFIASSPKVSSLKAEVEGLRAADDARKKRLADLLQDVVTTCESNPTFEQIVAAKRDLEKAESDLVKNDDEMLGLKQVQKTLLQVESARQSVRDKEYMDQVAELMEDARQIDGLDRPQLRTLISRATELAQPFRVSPSVVNGSQVKPLLSKLKDAESNLALKSERSEAVQRLTDSVGQEQRYRLALEKLNSIFQTGPSAKDFSEILSNELADFSSFVTGWNRAAQGWNPLSMKDPVNLASVGLPILDTFSKDYSDIPNSPVSVEMSSFLNSVVKRGPSGKTQLEALAKYLDAPLFKLQCVQEKSTKALLYVSQAPIKNSRGIIEVRPLESPDKIFAIGVKPNMGPFTELAPGKFAKLAPHSELASQLKDTLTDDAKTYETRVCQVLFQIINAKNVSPIIRAEMLLKFTDNTLEGSSLLKRELSGLKSEVQVMENFGDLNWFKPTDEIVSKMVTSATREIDNLQNKPEKIFKDKVQPAYAKLEASKMPVPTVKWVGVLLRNDKADGTPWICAVPPSTSQAVDAPLFVRYQANNKKTTEQVGELQGGRPVLNQNMQKHFKDGRPVWILQQ